MLHDLALEDPHLDADHAVGRAGNAVAEVDVCTQRVQRHAALAVPLRACDFRATQTPGDVDADAERTEAKRRLHGPLHGAAERDASLQLLRDRLGDKRRIDLRLADLEFSRKRIAQDVKKCVMSAVANAENNHGLDVNELVVSEAFVGKNLIMRRFAARGRGRASSIMKPFAQLTVIVRQKAEEAEEGAKKSKGKAKAAAKPAKGGKPATATKGGKAKAAAKETA